jgi:2-haloacid dehalogenase
MVARNVAVFDLGGVLVDWNPRHLYRKLFGGDEAAMEHFLATVCTQAWNECQDAGRTFAEATAELVARHPEKIALIEAYGKRFDEMMAGPIAGTVEILAELRRRDVPLYALSNWSAETFPLAERRFDFLRWFRGIVLSGQEKVIKPDRRIFEILLARYGLLPRDLDYIDDNAKNAAAAAALGMPGIHFVDPPALRRELVEVGLLEPVPSPACGGG